MAIVSGPFATAVLGWLSATQPRVPTAAFLSAVNDVISKLTNRGEQFSSLLNDFWTQLTTALENTPDVCTYLRCEPRSLTHVLCRRLCLATSLRAGVSSFPRWSLRRLRLQLQWPVHHQYRPHPPLHPHHPALLYVVISTPSGAS